MAAKRKPAVKEPAPEETAVSTPEKETVSAAPVPEETPAVEETVVVEETAVGETATAVVSDEPPHPPDLPSDALVVVRLTGAPAAMLGGVAMVRGEARMVPYAYLLEALPHHPGKFSVKYPGSSEFVSV